MKTTFLRPGILVSLKTQVSGGVNYSRVDLDAGATAPGAQGDGEAEPSTSEISRWETTRTVVDPAEHDRATKARSAASVAVRSQCARTSFGLLCPEGNERALDAAIDAARELVDAFNAGAKCTQIRVYVIKGRIASSDEEAARAISSEIRGMLEQMQRGIDMADPAAIRDAAARARQMSAMLDESRQATVARAIESARAAAREIVKRVEKGGETAQVVLAELDRGAIQSARMSFLDLEEAPAVGDDAESPALPAVHVQRFDLDFEPAPSAAAEA